ncbi:hypothetical protein, partial [Corallococcus sp. CA047B]|uniref:tetratricopeptide repeat protein n=1 Tax=Corallococcus sp. CA047B TaxID=2316729 RepID=UPI00131564B8
MGGGTNGKGPGTPEPPLRGPGLAQRGEDVLGAADAVCRDAARLLREGQAARAYSGLVAASRSLSMTPRLAATLVRCALKAGTERAVITLLDAAMVTERGAVRREVRRQLSRVLRRTGQEARAAAVLNGLLMDAPDDARARYVLDVLRERQAKAKGATSRRTAEEDEESRTKTVEVSALALSDPERGNTVVELPTVSVEARGASSRAARADTVQVPLGEWAGLGRATARGPDFPWEDEGPGKARVVTPPQGARLPSTADAERSRGISPVVASAGSQPSAGSDAERVRAPAPVLPAVGPQAAVVEGPVAAVSEEPSLDSLESAEALESEHADAAMSFRSTDLPFVTADADRPVREGRTGSEPASPVGGASVDVAGASLDSREGKVAPSAVADVNAGAGASSTLAAGPGSLRSPGAGTDVSSESPVQPAVGVQAMASAAGNSTLEQGLSSQSDAILTLGVSTHASDEKSASPGVSSPADAALTSDEQLAVALGVSSPADVAQTPEEQLAASLGVSSPMDAAQTSDEKSAATLSQSSSADVAQPSDDQLAAALGVASPMDVTPSLGEKSAPPSSELSPLDMAQVSDEKSAAQRVESPAGVTPSLDAGAPVSSASAPVDVMPAPADGKSALTVASPVDVMQASAEGGVASNAPSPADVPQAFAEKPAAAPIASSQVEVRTQALDEKADASSVPSRVEMAPASDAAVAMSSASSFKTTQPPDAQAAATGVSVQGEAPQETEGLPKAAEAHPTAQSRPLPQSAPLSDAEVPSKHPGAKSTDAAPPSSQRDASSLTNSDAREDAPSPLASNAEATPPPARTPAPLGAASVSGGPSTSLEGASASESIPPRTLESSQKTAADKDAAGRKPSRVLDSVLVQGAPSHAFDEDESTSEMILPRPPEPVVAGAPSKAVDADKSKPRPLSAVLVPGAPAMAFDQEEPTSEIIPPAKADAEKDALSSPQARDEKSRAQPPASSPRRTTVLVPAASNPAFDAEESTSEVIPPPGDAAPSSSTPARDSGRFPAVKPSGSGADAAPGGDAAASSSVPSPEEGAELARSQREESQLIARRAWRELAQLYLKRADRAKDAPARAEALTRLAEVMENELQDSAGAARMYREIVELTGERTALREQVRLLSLREDASLVRRALDDAIKRARTSRARAIALLTRGERQLNMGAPAKAREDLEAAEALVPGLLPVLAGLVRCVSDEERPAHTERLRAACAAAPRRAPDRLDALRVLAQTAEESLGDLRIAQWAWAEVLAESPDSEQPREHLLALARRLGDLPALSQLLHAQLAREPRGPAARKAHLERVATLEAMGDAGAALAELRQAVRFEPGHKEAWLLLADRCTEREQMGEAAWALENAATATEDDEERQRMWERLALFCREVLHNTERARTYARRAESLRKSRDARARPPPPEPPRTAPAPALGVPPPSVLVAPPVPTGRVPVKSKDLSDEVTSNTDVGSLVAAEQSSPAAEQRPVQAKDGAARKSAASGAKSSSSKSDRGTPGAEDAAEMSRAASAKASAGSHAPVAEAGAGARKSGVVKAPSGSHASVSGAAPGEDSFRRPTSAKAASGSAASATDTSPNAEVPLKSSSGSPTPGDDAAAKGRKPGAVKAPSGSHAPVGASTAGRKSGAVKAPTESPPSLADAAPGPSTSARASSSKSARGAATSSGQASDTGLPVRGPAPMREDEAPGVATGRNPRVPSAPPRERTTAFGAPIEPDSEPVPSQVLAAPPTPSAVSRKAAASTPAASRDPGPATPKARASAPSRADSARQPPAAPPSHPWDDEEEDHAPVAPPPGARSANAEANARNAAAEGASSARPARAPSPDGGTQVREAAVTGRPERAPRA